MILDILWLDAPLPHGRRQIGERAIRLGHALSDALHDLAACSEIQALLQVIDAICSLDADVFSRDAACSEALWASCWLNDADPPDAPAV